MRRPDLNEKEMFSLREAAEFYNLSYRKFYRMIETGNRFPFLAYYKQRRLIIRSDFEKYLEMHPDLKEGLKNGRAPIPKKKRLETPGPAQRGINQG